MSMTKHVSLLAGAAISLGTFGSAFAAEGQASGTSDELRAIVADMLADAETRSSLLQSGGMGGYDDGFFIADGSGNFRLNVGGLVQFRYMLNFRDDDDSVSDSDFESGFQTRRTKLVFDGHVIDPNLFYQVKGEFSRDGGNFNLQDAFVGYRWDNGFHLKWGQYRLAFLREFNVLPEYQLAADRSITDSFFNQGDSQGIELGYSGEDFRVMASFSDGFRSQDTDFGTNKTFAATYGVGGELSSFSASGNNGGEADLAITARGEIKFAGTWEQFEDFTSMPNGDSIAVLLGVAGHIEYTDADRVNVAGGSGEDATYFTYTVDLSVEGDGWNFFLAGIGGHTQIDNVLVDNILGDTEDIEYDDFGIVAQGGIFIPETDWEVFARYDAIFFDDEDRVLDEDTFQTVTAGVNWYWSGHAAKFTADVQWFLDEGEFVGSNTGAGYIFDTNDNQFTFRLQFQLLF